MLTIPALQIVFDQIVRKGVKWVHSFPEPLDHHLPNRADGFEFHFDGSKNILICTIALVVAPGISCAERQRGVVIEENYRRGEESVRQFLDANAFGAIVKNDGAILVNRADIFTAPMMHVKAGPAVFRGLELDGELDPHAVE